MEMETETIHMDEEEPSYYESITGEFLLYKQFKVVQIYYE